MNWEDISVVIFDADGTLRRRKDGQKKAPLKNDEWELVPGVKESIDKIRGFPITFGIASNQACVSRGEVGEADAMFMLSQLAKELELHVPMSVVQLCTHEPGTCVCRKPQPGMLYAIMMFWGVAAKETVVVGDSISDRKAAENAGCHFMFTEQFLELGKE